MKKEISPILFTEITITELNLMIYLTTFSYKSSPRELNDKRKESESVLHLR